ncbi:S1C family serine protease [Nocardioides sp. Soil805]|uniref:S1C family serine protease n=1 Tax=Nocardioides sp. Soil805 TaxID=1736416 RepID=UPI0009EA1F59|nr:trypsin-like peptidase domain-containing protein [Nocardioides sp. Soil805]
MSTVPPPPPQDPTSHPYGTQAYGTNPYQQAPPAPPAPPRRRRGGLVAGVLATTLLVGGGAGFGGAALWDQTQGSSTSSTATATATTPVVDQGDSPAADGSVEAVATAVLPSVVTIRVAGQQGEGSGSGIILSADGTILTNNHVVEVAAGGGGTVRVYFADGTSAPAEVLGTDPLTDTAVIKADGVSDLTPATIGKSANLDVGQDVVAFGAPFGLDSTVTSGIVSALDRPVNVGTDSQGNSTTYPAIQTDAAINPGNSGGPLVDMTGAVVGINSSIRTASQSTSEQGGSIGLGFAIPIDEVMPIVDQMIAGDTPTHARLGIQVGDSGTAAEGATGALVKEVSDGSTAGEAGLEAGDVITRVEDHAITDADSLVATIRSYRPGDKVEVTWTSGGQEQSATLALDSDAATS